MTAPDFVAFDAPLRDGRTVHIRAIGPSDEAEVLQAFDRMSADARYMRFMRVVREPNRERLRKALEAMPSKGFGVVATAPAADGFDIVGSATYMVGSDPLRGEFAINVDADYGGAARAARAGGLRADREQADAAPRRRARLCRHPRSRGSDGPRLPPAPRWRLVAQTRRRTVGRHQVADDGGGIAPSARSFW